MTHPSREELADRLDLEASHVNGHGYCEAVLPVLLRSAAAALRKSPSVEEVARVIDGEAMDYDLTGEPKIIVRRVTERRMAALAKAQAIDALYRRGGG